MTITKNVWKAAAFLLILCLVSTVMISGTYAKYTSTYAGEDTALVAKWNIVATGGGIGIADGATVDLDLFKHSDANVATSTGGMYIIAPGVQGQFTLEFKNNSDVAAKIGFVIAKTGTDVPITFSLNSDFSNPKTTIGDLQKALNEDLELADLDMGESVSKTVYWKWAFTGNDSGDTALGKASAAAGSRTTYGLTVTANAEQQD